jgi:cytosine/adenosine deaminase-related metal-dependent hydrolase/ubiquinone/menaquinone biosynthesis C-methylase UbiE
MKAGLATPVKEFDAWAEVYDDQPNPLLALEQRVLGPMLPDVRGLDVLDLGCGTGRWLTQLAQRFPRKLLGVDNSPAMLLLASTKLHGNCELRSGSCTDIPVSDTAADVVMACFVISYLEELDVFAREVDRVARPGATIFLADMHPETEAACGWTRSIDSDTRMLGRGWSLQQIIQAFQSRGFTLVSLTEPSFGVEERPIFESHGKINVFESTGTRPAIYILQLRKPVSSPRLRRVASQSAGSLVLENARCAIGPDTAALASISVLGTNIHSIHACSGSVLENRLDLSGYLLLPGLINGHDHLEFGLHPNIGDGPYYNAAQWARDIHANQADLIARHRSVPRAICSWWGAIRNLLCGATTVCHHNPLTPDLTSSEFPIRVVSEFGWAHSTSFEPGLAAKFAASRPDRPFILHAAEGIDEGSGQEIFELDRIGALDHRTVIVHGLACPPDTLSLINRRGAALIVCPTSNQFLFHRAPSIAFIGSLDNVILGSDSPLTAAGDLLDEIAFASTRIGLDPNSLYSMVTEGPAKVLRLRRGEGSLKPGSVADLLVVRDSGLSPAETLARLTWDQIELVLLAGRVQLAGPNLIERLPDAIKQALYSLEVEGQVRWVRAPVEKLLAQAEEVLGSDLRVGGKRVSRASAA